MAEDTDKEMSLPPQDARISRGRHGEGAEMHCPALPGSLGLPPGGPEPCDGHNVNKKLLSETVAEATSLRPEWTISKSDSSARGVPETDMTEADVSINAGIGLARDILYSDRLDRRVSITPDPVESQREPEEVYGCYETPTYAVDDMGTQEEQLEDPVVIDDSDNFEMEGSKMDNRSAGKRRADRSLSGESSQSSLVAHNLAANRRIIKKSSMRNSEKIRRISKRRGRSIDSSTDDTSIVLMEVNTLAEFDTDKLTDYALECLDKMTFVINKTSSIQGKLKGRYKVGIHNMERIVNILRDRLQESGDVASTKTQNTILTAKLLNMKREIETNSRELSLANEENKNLKQEIANLQDKLRRRDAARSGTPSVSGAAEVAPKSDAMDLGAGFRVPDVASGVIRSEGFPTLPSPLPQRKRKPQIVDTKKLSIRVTKAVEDSMDVFRFGRDDNALTSESNRKGNSPKSVFRFAPVRTEDAGGGSGSAPDLGKISEQVIQLTQRMNELQQMLAAHSDEPPDVPNRRGGKKSRLTSTRSDFSAPSGASEVETVVPITPTATSEDRLNQNDLNRNTGISTDRRDTRERTRPRRPPRTAAVSITSLNPSKLSYADMLRKARENISLDKLGIERSKIRKGVSGGIIIEIPGEDGATKADSLAGKLREVLGAGEARVTRPTTMGEVRIWNFDDSIAPAEIVSEISVLGDCDENLIKLGNIRKMNNGLNSVWAKCPLTAAGRITSSNKLKLGWTMARIEMLAAKPVQCFKCWRFGHVSNNCPFPENRAGNCFRCGAQDHHIGDCKSNPYCVVCAGAGRTSDHRLGSTRSCLTRELPPARTAAARNA